MKDQNADRDDTDSDRQPRELSMDASADYECAWCGETITTPVDFSGGSRQAYIEDCQVCCRPNRLELEFEHDGSAHLRAEPE